MCLAVRLELAAEEGREKGLDRGPRGGQCQVGKDGGGAEVEGGAEEVGEEVVLRAEEKNGLLSRIALEEKKISDLQKELEEAKAMGFVSASGLGAAGPSTLRKRNPS